jgi:chitin synthase
MYPSSSKMLFIVADGLVTGSGNGKSTPDIVLDLIEVDRSGEQFACEEDEDNLSGDAAGGVGGSADARGAGSGDGSRLKDPMFDYATPREFLACAEGSKRQNYARVVRGWYTPTPEGRAAPNAERCPVLVVIKCGSDAERTDASNKKPGNRGKRDSQLVLMQWLSRLLFNDRMTELDYWMFTFVRKSMGFTPDMFEACVPKKPESLVFLF